MHPTTVYRRWGTKARLVGEALLDRARPLRPTPDTGALRTDLVQLLTEGGTLIRTASVRALFAVLIEEAADPSSEVAEARDRFWAAHMEEARRIVARAVARSELPVGADPQALVDLVIGPALLRALLMGRDLGPNDARLIVGRAIAALQATARGFAKATGGLRSSEEVARMPQKEHLPSVSAKEQRMYEHIKASEQKQDRTTKRAKAIAAATVVKHHNKKGHTQNK